LQSVLFGSRVRRVRGAGLQAVLRAADGRAKGGKKSLRAISAGLAAQGFLNERGRPFNPQSIAAMLAGFRQRQMKRAALLAKLADDEFRAVAERQAPRHGCNSRT
jgi:hypothetical protein